MKSNQKAKENDLITASNRTDPFRKGEHLCENNGRFSLKAAQKADLM